MVSTRTFAASQSRSALSRVKYVTRSLSAISPGRSYYQRKRARREEPQRSHALLERPLVRRRLPHHDQRLGFLSILAA
jgi:hypothetical protein